MLENTSVDALRIGILFFVYLIYALEKTIHFKLKTLHVTCLERVVEEIVRAVRALVA